MPSLAAADHACGPKTSGLLAKFRAAKEGEIAALRALQAAGRLPAPLAGERASLVQALLARGPGAVIAEYKRASPSQGDINLGHGPEDVAALYGRGGAAAISVLTESVYFKGGLEYLPRMLGPGLPLLRKDFLFDPLQIQATAAAPASALLLIARCFATAGALAAMIDQALALGLEPVTEVFGETDLALARQAQARIIQVNSRDLDTLAMDMTAHGRLIEDRRPGETWIAASGVSKPEQVRDLARLGYDGVLVGTSLMAAPDPEAALAALVAGAREARP